jgi:predicted alpha-1,6-mannanase (GH76 family)
LYIAIYAELGHLTQNSTATGLAERTAKAAMTTGQWHTDKGVIKEGEGDAAVSDDGIGFKSIMIRYLAKVHPWLADEGVKAAIVQYINIQYWALTTLASNSATHPVQYGRNWNGPAYTVSTVHAQL